MTHRDKSRHIWPDPTEGVWDEEVNPIGLPSEETTFRGVPIVWDKTLDARATAYGRPLLDSAWRAWRIIKALDKVMLGKRIM